MRGAAAVVMVALGAAGAAAQVNDAQPAVDLQGKLYKAVFSAGAGMLTPADLTAVPEPLRTRLQTFLMRRAGFKSRYKHEPDTLEEVREDAKKRVLERAIVSLIDAPGIEKTAAELVAAAPIADEWHGMHDGPLQEASYIENALKRNPASALAPWFYVFIAERQRIAFEAYANLKNQEGMIAAAKKYRAFVERARAAADPIFAALVDDMERRPYLYIKTTDHPRDYAPDG